MILFFVCRIQGSALAAETHPSLFVLRFKTKRFPLVPCRHCRSPSPSPRPLSAVIAMISQRLFAAANWLLLFPVLIDATCYNVDGTTTGLDNSFKPCNSSAEVSTCCATNKGSNADVCLTSGLCYTQGEGYSGMIYMNGCTDKTGKSDSCAHFCPDGEFPAILSSFLPFWITEHKHTRTHEHTSRGRRRRRNNEAIVEPLRHLSSLIG